MNDVSPLALSGTEGAAPLSQGRAPRALQRLLQRRLQPLLDRLECGTLRVRLPGTPGQPDGALMQAHGQRPGPAAELVLHHWRALWRLASGGDIGLAEAYRDGDWSTPDLTALLELGARNEAAWQGASAAAGPWRWAQRLLHRLRDNTRRGSRRNIASHYDLGNDFYRAWLDDDLVYSSGLYRDAGDTLAQAQAAKLDRVAELLDLPGAGQPCDVLEIGCGWGALACGLARRGATVRGLTLSTEQLAHARERAAREGLQDRVNLQLQDYRDERGQHDRIVSIEMIEAVGEAWWPTYFATLRDRLKPGGVAVIQAITIADQAFESYRRGADFIQHLVFPGGMLPSPGVLQREAARAGLVIEHSETFGPSYARTLVDWRQRFEAAWPQIAPLGFDERFRRLWRYYLCYCEAGFNTGRVDVGLYRLRHAGGMNAAQA